MTRNQQTTPADGDHTRSSLSRRRLRAAAAAGGGGPGAAVNVCVASSASCLRCVLPGMVPSVGPSPADAS